MIRNEYLRELTLDEAQAAVAASVLSSAEKTRYQQFLRHFPTARFYQDTPLGLDEVEAEHDVQLPAWFREHRCTLGGCFLDTSLLSFDASNLSGLQFQSQFDGYNAETRALLLDGSARLQLFPIGHDEADPDSQLAINLRGQDPRIYSFRGSSLAALRYKGEAIDALVLPVYASPGAMLAGLAQVQEYRWQPTPTGTQLATVQTLQARR